MSNTKQYRFFGAAAVIYSRKRCKLHKLTEASAINGYNARLSVFVQSFIGQKLMKILKSSIPILLIAASIIITLLLASSTLAETSNKSSGRRSQLSSLFY